MDCLILLPKRSATMAELVLAAACLQAEKWRFTYGRKLTPSRIADFKLPKSAKLMQWIDQKIDDIDGVIDASLAPYEDDSEDIEDARSALAEIAAKPEVLVSGDALRERLDRCEQP